MNRPDNPVGSLAGSLVTGVVYGVVGSLGSSSDPFAIFREQGSDIFRENGSNLDKEH